MLVAYALPRLSSEEEIPISDLNVQIHDVCPQFSSERLQRIQAETAKDPELSALKEVVYNGWPTTVRELPSLIQPYWTCQPPRYRENQAKGTNIDMLEEPEH